VPLLYPAIVQIDLIDGVATSSGLAGWQVISPIPILSTDVILKFVAVQHFWFTDKMKTQGAET
jgi:hypothetical protein